MNPCSLDAQIEVAEEIISDVCERRDMEHVVSTTGGWSWKFLLHSAFILSPLLLWPNAENNGGDGEKIEEAKEQLESAPGKGALDDFKAEESEEESEEAITKYKQHELARASATYKSNAQAAPAEASGDAAADASGAAAPGAAGSGEGGEDEVEKNKEASQVRRIVHSCEDV